MEYIDKLIREDEQTQENKHRVVGEEYIKIRDTIDNLNKSHEQIYNKSKGK